MTVMSAAKASAEASALVLAHADCVPPELWLPPGMAPMDLCHSLSLRQVPQKRGDAGVSAGAASRAQHSQGGGGSGVGPPVDPQWGPQSVAPQQAMPHFSRMYAVPQVGPAPGPPACVNVGLAYPTPITHSQHGHPQHNSQRGHPQHSQQLPPPPPQHVQVMVQPYLGY